MPTSSQANMLQINKKTCPIWVRGVTMSTTTTPCSTLNIETHPSTPKHTQTHIPVPLTTALSNSKSNRRGNIPLPRTSIYNNSSDKTLQKLSNNNNNNNNRPVNMGVDLTPSLKYNHPVPLKKYKPSATMAVTMTTTSSSSSSSVSQCQCDDTTTTHSDEVRRIDTTTGTHTNTTTNTDTDTDEEFKSDPEALKSILNNTGLTFEIQNKGDVFINKVVVPRPSLKEVEGGPVMSTRTRELFKNFQDNCRSMSTRMTLDHSERHTLQMRTGPASGILNERHTGLRGLPRPSEYTSGWTHKNSPAAMFKTPQSLSARRTVTLFNTPQPLSARRTMTLLNTPQPLSARRTMTLFKSPQPLSARRTMTLFKTPQPLSARRTMHNNSAANTMSSARRVQSKSCVPHTSNTDIPTNTNTTSINTPSVKHVQFKDQLAIKLFQDGEGDLENIPPLTQDQRPPQKRPFPDLGIIPPRVEPITCFKPPDVTQTLHHVNKSSVNCGVVVSPQPDIVSFTPLPGPSMGAITPLPGPSVGSVTPLPVRPDPTTRVALQLSSAKIRTDRIMDMRKIQEKIQKELQVLTTRLNNELTALCYDDDDESTTTDNPPPLPSYTA